MYGPGHRGIPGPDLVPSFSGPTHTLGAVAPFGFCAYCHNDKAVNMTDSGVSVQCTFCHATMLTPDYGPGHRSLPGPQQVQSFPGPEHKLGPEKVYGQCGFCHYSTTVTALMSSGHGDLNLVCENCHSVLRPNDYGPGHGRTPHCAECHTPQQTHAGSGGGDGQRVHQLPHAARQHQHFPDQRADPDAEQRNARRGVQQRHGARRRLVRQRHAARHRPVRDVPHAHRVLPQ